MSIPLPPLPFGWWKDKVTQSEMEHFIHTHAAAVSADKDAEIAGLRKTNASQSVQIIAQADRIKVLEDALSKIDAIRNDIIGRQKIGWSSHVYPLVAALGEAGYPGLDYEAARAALGDKPTPDSP